MLGLELHFDQLGYGCRDCHAFYLLDDLERAMTQNLSRLLDRQ